MSCNQSDQHLHSGKNQYAPNYGSSPKLKRKINIIISVSKQTYSKSNLNSCLSYGFRFIMVAVVLPDSFRGMGAWKNSTETQKSGHAPRSGPEVKNGSGACRKRLAASTWWCGPRPSFREVGRNGETTTPRGPTIRSPPIVWNFRVGCTNDD